MLYNFIVYYIILCFSIHSRSGAPLQDVLDLCREATLLDGELGAEDPEVGLAI